MQDARARARFRQLPYMTMPSDSPPKQRPTGARWQTWIKKACSALAPQAAPRRCLWTTTSWWRRPWECCSWCSASWLRLGPPSSRRPTRLVWRRLETVANATMAMRADALEVVEEGRSCSRGSLRCFATAHLPRPLRQRRWRWRRLRPRRPRTERHPCANAKRRSLRLLTLAVALSPKCEAASAARSSNTVLARARASPIPPLPVKRRFSLSACRTATHRASAASARSRRAEFGDVARDERGK